MKNYGYGYMGLSVTDFEKLIMERETNEKDRDGEVYGICVVTETLCGILISNDVRYSPIEFAPNWKGSP